MRVHGTKREHESRSSMTRRWALLSMLVCSTNWPANADDGRIPIYQPTTITQSGSYVLTRDVVGSTSAFVILIIQAADVSIDLNGYRIVDSGEDIGIRVDSPTSHLRIRNGTITSVGPSIYSTVGLELELDGVALNSDNNGVVSSQPMTLRVRRSSVFGNFAALGLGSGSTVDVSDSSLVGGDTALSCSACNNSRIVNNAIYYGGFSVSVGMGSVLEHNTFRGEGATALSLGTRSRLTSNTFYGGVNVSGDGNLIDGNQFFGPDARLVVGSNQNRIVNNQISGTTSNGIEIAGLTNLVEGNSVTSSNAFGIS